MKFLIKLSLILAIVTTASAQKKVKFGKVTQAELEKTASLIDPEAHAEILYDKGDSHFEYSDQNGFQFVFERHQRIKIYAKEGYDYATVRIPFYQANVNAREKVGVIKAYTYNLEDGKVVKTKVANSDIFEEQLNKYWYVKKFAFPAVKEGTVIEYTYSIVSDFIQNLREWEFQSDIPTVYTQYDVSILEYYNYQKISQGYVNFSINETNSKVENFQYKWRSEVGIGGQVDKGVGTITSNSETYRWAAENVPAVKEEPYMTSIEDYKAKIGFQLISYRYPNSTLKIVAGSYEDFNENLINADYFGDYLHKTNFLRETVASITNGKSPYEQQLAIYSYVKNNFNWNGFTGIYPKNPKETFKEKEGNVAAINFLLTMMMKEAGFNSDPVLLGTRDHGRPHPIYPNREKLNYLLCFVETEEGGVLLDATRKSLPFGMITENCHNGKGYKISSTTPGWVPLQSAYKNSQTVQAKLVVQETGEISGDITISSEGNVGRAKRKLILNDGEEKYFNAIDENLLDWKLSETSIEGTDDIYSDLTSKFKVNNEDNIDSDIIYIPALLYGAYDENPFKSELRTQPVDFPSGFSRRYMMELSIPDNYEVEEMPDPTVFQLPDRAAVFQFSCTVVNGKINIASVFQLKKTFYLPEEYAYIRQFYDLMINKQAEQIVLKKKMTE